MFKPFRQYPRAVMREKRTVFSEVGLKRTVTEGKRVNKVCLMSLYSFTIVRNRKVVWESALIDCILWEGKKGYCESMINKFPKFPSLLIFDGTRYQAIVFKYSTLEEMGRLRANTQLNKMILIPGYMNFRAGKKCMIIKKRGI